MNPVPSRAALAGRFLLFARAMGVAAAFVGCAVLVGWSVDLDVLKSVIPGSASMKPNTAIAFVLLGLALWLSHRMSPGDAAQVVTRRRAAIVCATVAALIGMATLIEYVLRLDLGIDVLMFPDTQTPYPGRMAVVTALEFAVFGTALASIDVQLKRGQVPAQYLALPGIVVGLIGVASYAYRSNLAAFVPYTSMSVHTAVLFTLVGFGVLFSRPDRGIAAILTDEGFGGRLARRGLPVALLLPFFIDGVETWGERAEWFTSNVSAALFATADAVVLSAIVWWSANSLKGAEASRAQADEALFRLGHIVESSDDAIIGKTLDGTIVNWNGGAERVFGYTAAEALNRPITMLMPPDRLDEEPQLLRRLQRGEHVHHFETVRRRKDGELIDILLTISPILGEDGRIVGVSKIARDITDRKRTEQALRDRDAADEANRLKSEFLASMSHELRTPLNAIIGFTGTLLMKLPGPLNAVQEEQLRTVQGSARHLLALINDVLDSAKIEAGKVTVFIEPTACQEVLREVSAMLSPIAEAKGLAFLLTMPDEDLVLHTDRRLLAQIVLNLVNNAIKFTDTGGVRVELARRHTERGSCVEVAVEDTG